jgi:spermidine synthase
MTALFELPSPFAAEPGLIRLLEPADSDAATLAAQLLAGRYTRPFVLENGGLRALHFSLGYVQSVMRIGAPAALELGYAQRMMAFLLFNPRPRRLMMVGLGGGSLVAFCHRHLPGARMTVLEIDADVIALREVFELPPDDERLQVIHCDGARYIEDSAERCDVLLVDAFGADGVAAELLHTDFYENARRRLGGKGMLVMNVAGDREGYARHVERLLEVFDERVIAISVREDGNYILFAFCDPAFAPRWKWMRAIALELQARFKLDFPTFAQQLERGQVLRLAQRLAG